MIQGICMTASGCDLQTLNIIILLSRMAPHYHVNALIVRMTKSLSFYFDGFAILEWLIGHKIAIKRRLGTDIRIVRGGGGGGRGALARKNSEMIKTLRRYEKWCKSQPYNTARVCCGKG